MKKIKFLKNTKLFKYFKKRLKSFRKNKFYKKYNKVILISFLVVFIIFLFIQTSLSSVSEVRLDFLNLVNEYEASVPCHEDCLINRRRLKDKVVANWTNDKNIYFDWQRYFQEAIEGKNYELQKELINIAFEISDNEDVSLFLADCLLNIELDSQTRANIINNYFSKLNDNNLAAFYFNLISEGDDNLKRSALLAISNFTDKEAVISEDRLLLLRDLIISPVNSSAVVTDALFLLFELELSYSKESRDALIFVYQNTYSREIKYLVAKHLQSLGIGDYPVPIISESQLEAYFSK